MLGGGAAQIGVIGAVYCWPDALPGQLAACGGHGAGRPRLVGRAGLWRKTNVSVARFRGGTMQLAPTAAGAPTYTVAFPPDRLSDAPAGRAGQRVHLSPGVTPLALRHASAGTRQSRSDRCGS